MATFIEGEPVPKRPRKNVHQGRSCVQTRASTESFHDDEQPSQSNQRSLITEECDDSIVSDELVEQLQRLSQQDRDEYPHSTSQHENPIDQLDTECAKRPLLDGKFFELHKEGSTVGGTILVVCQNCNPENILKTSLRTTSNLTTHLKKQHPSAYEAYKQYAQSNKQVVDRKRWSCTFSQEQWDANITAFVLDTMAPLRTVENKSFRKIFDDLHIMKNGTSVKHMIRYTLLMNINRLAEEQCKEIKRIMQRTEFVCTTADAWSGKKRRFLGVTLHWIDETSLDRKSAAIACRRFPGTHSYDTIARHLNDIHTSYNLDSSMLVATITDNGSNFVKAFKEFGVDATIGSLLQESTLNRVDGTSSANEVVDELSVEASAELDEDFSNECGMQLPKHLRCAIHTLNLIATTATTRAINDSSELSEIHKNAMAKCNTLWKSLRLPKTSEALRNYLGVALKRPVVTRWNSMFDALKQLVLCKDKLLRNGSRRENVIALRESFTVMEFRYIEEYLRCTQDLAKAIDLLQGETYCHYGYLLPTLVQLRRQMLALKDSTDIKDCQPIVAATIHGLETRFAAMFQITGDGKGAVIAAVSHPKFKIRWLRCLLEDKQKLVYELIVNAVAAEFKETVPANPEPTPEDDWDFGNEPTIFENLQTSVNHAASEVEVTRYLEDPEKELKILRKYPIIRKVFIKWNTPLPSFAAVERLFSYATMMDLPKYNRLTDAHFEQRVLAKANSSKQYL